MKSKLFRVAHIGYYDYLDTIGILGALEHVLAYVARPRHVEFGLGLKAAQEVYARAVAEKQPMAVGSLMAKTASICLKAVNKSLITRRPPSRLPPPFWS